MNSHHDHLSDSDSALESLIRSRAGRLAPPDPAWRETILSACKPAAGANADDPKPTATAADEFTMVPTLKSAATAAKSIDQPSARHLWLTFPRSAAWSSLAACWLAVLALNHETRQLNTCANSAAGSQSSASSPVALATFSSLPQGGNLFLLQPDPAILTFLQNRRPHSSSPPHPAKRRPPHSSLAPARPLPDPLV